MKTAQLSSSCAVLLMFNLKNFLCRMKILTDSHRYLLNNHSIYLKPNN